jgi:Xaa-Pro aminopeptidase
VSAARADALEALVVERGLDLLIVGDLVHPGDSYPEAAANLRWLTGFTGTSGLALVGHGTRVLLTDFRYRERAAEQADPSFEVDIVTQRILPELAGRLRGRVGFDDAATSVHNFRKLEKELAAGVDLLPVSGFVERLRRRKDDAELAAIQAAARLADEALEEVLGEGLAGRVERDVARAIGNAIRERGGELAFPPIVASGPNGALPHADPEERTIGKGELVVIDWGARLRGYCSDCTRTVAAGEPGHEEREIYELVQRAQASALDAVAPGVSGAEADEVARNTIAEAGHSERFGHGLGHGVGLEIHEAPRLGQSSDDVLVEGDVVTVEPGVYLSGRFGVRVEDLVTVTADGARVLTSHPKELRVVD